MTVSRERVAEMEAEVDELERRAQAAVRRATAEAEQQRRSQVMADAQRFRT
jgi:D-alanyl-D-alanine dipeptidase